MIATPATRSPVCTTPKESRNLAGGDNPRIPPPRTRVAPAGARQRIFFIVVHISEFRRFATRLMKTTILISAFTALFSYGHAATPTQSRGFEAKCAALSYVIQQHTASPAD